MGEERGYQGNLILAEWIHVIFLPHMCCDVTEVVSESTESEALVISRDL